MIRSRFALVVSLFGAALFGPIGAARCFGQQYDVRTFGAKGDGTTKDTAAFQKALDTCAVNGGGDVLVPAGNYLIGSVQIGTRTMIHLDKDATLTGTTSLDDYPIILIRWEGRWELGHRALIYAANVDHIGIVGPGHIVANFGGAGGGRGRGAAGGATQPGAAARGGGGGGPGIQPGAFAGGPGAPGAFPGAAAVPAVPPVPGAGGPGFAAPGAPGAGRGRGGAGGAFVRGPLLLEPISCNDVRFEDFTGDHTGTWANHPTYCTNVLLRNLTLTNSSDGLDVDSCDGVIVDGCTITGGDDAISIKSGRGMDGARLGKPCENILVTNCTLYDRGNACIGMGSEMSGGVNNMLVEHCKFLHAGASWFSIYIKTRPGRAGTTQNITFNDIDVSDSGGFLRINTLNGGNMSTADDPVEGDIGLPLIKNIVCTNIRVKNVVELVAAFQTNPAKPVDGLTLENISGDCGKGMTLINVNNVVLKNITVTGFAGSLLSTDNTTGTGLEGAVKYVAPPPAAAGAGGRRGGRGRGAAPGAATPGATPPAAAP